MFWLILIIGIVVSILSSESKSNKFRENDENTQRIQKTWLERNNVKINTDYRYVDVECNIRCIVDNENSRILLSNTSNVFDSIPFNELIGCEILEDSEVSGGIGRAVIGGFIAGGAGAIVGANTAKKEISSYKIIWLLSLVSNVKVRTLVHLI